MTDELPPLPEPFLEGIDARAVSADALFTAEQMRAYARSARATLERDAARYRWLRPRLFSADWAYGSPPVSVVTFRWPDVFVGLDLDKCIDLAISQDAT